MIWFFNKTSPELNFCQHLDFVTVAAFLENDQPCHWLWENGLDEDKNLNTHVAPWKWKWPRIKRIWILTFPHENAGWVTNVFARLETHLQLLAFYQNCWKSKTFHAMQRSLWIQYQYQDKIQWIIQKSIAIAIAIAIANPPSSQHPSPLSSSASPEHKVDCRQHQSWKHQLWKAIKMKCQRV